MADITVPPVNPNTILLRGDQARKRDEGRVHAGKTVYPGMLLERVATGNSAYGDYQPHSGAALNGERIIALESGFVVDIPFAASFKGGTVDDTYGAGDLMFIHLCQNGDEIWGLLPASAAAITIDKYLCSNGDGRLKIWATNDVDPLFKALEAKDNSANAATHIRIRARAM